MYSRRDLLATALLSLAPAGEAARPRVKVAAATTAYFLNSHADVILSRLLRGENLDGKSRLPDMQLVNLYVEQFPANDISRRLAAAHGVRLCKSIAEAVSPDGKDLAVQGVLLVGEHGDYPKGPRGEELYPRKRFFDETTAVFKRTGKVAPVFNDKHLSHDWREAKAMYDTSKQMGFPMLAGSSLPLTWRRPALEVKRGAPLREIVGVSYHTLYTYGFHALEMMQCLAERRKGGETGVKRVQCLTGPAVWAAGRAGRFDLRLLDSALSRQTTPPPGASMQERLAHVERSVSEPSAFVIEYNDGFKGTMLDLDGAVAEWSVAWRDGSSPEPQGTLFWAPEERPFGHFTFLVKAIEEMVHTGRATYPVERTLLTSGLTHFMLESKHRGGIALNTPELAIRYAPASDWKDPGPPPPGRPLIDE